MKLGYNPLNTIPRDITAKRVVYDSGDHYNPKIKSNSHGYSTECPPLENINKLPGMVLKDPNFKNLTGLKIGCFKVMGLLKCKDFNKWVLKCCCGNYEIRTSKTIKKINPEKSDENRCQSCFEVERMRNREYFNKNGFYPWNKK